MFVFYSRKSVGVRYPRLECGRSPLYCRRQSSTTIFASKVDIVSFGRIPKGGP